MCWLSDDVAVLFRRKLRGDIIGKVKDMLI